MADTAEAAPPDPTKFITVKTTLPKRPTPENSVRVPFTTERLILRPCRPEDLDALRVLRTQPEVMVWTAIGRVDQDMAETEVKLAPFLPPRDVTNYNWAICLKENPDELIGIGGCHNWTSSFGWPEVGYMFRKECWGKGLATEFLKGFLTLWDALPREETLVAVDARTVDSKSTIAVDGEGVKEVEEQYIAVTAIANARSQNTLRKCGFEHFVTWKAQDSRDGMGKLIDLPTFRHFPRRSKGKGSNFNS
ncbi:GNAT domain-containing protein [Diplogelasinospora grovesii]|uniref:GNAT domain-containing protein n=1 Tax=Diplogelasinospora grovesii TaxID=303347 RepID=A0AAN6S700_9PEZI|nr:GNAT domain-containing protein [Diplogelasinospora grovesii]